MKGAFVKHQDKLVGAAEQARHAYQEALGDYRETLRKARHVLADGRIWIYGYTDAAPAFAALQSAYVKMELALQDLDSREEGCVHIMAPDEPMLSEGVCCRCMAAPICKGKPIHEACISADLAWRLRGTEEFSDAYKSALAQVRRFAWDNPILGVRLLVCITRDTSHLRCLEWVKLRHVIRENGQARQMLKGARCYPYPQHHPFFRIYQSQEEKME